ncbi:MAG: hypothetical protein ACRC4M_01110 [Mycoplasma sp.]
MTKMIIEEKTKDLVELLEEEYKKRKNSWINEIIIDIKGMNKEKTKIEHIYNKILTILKTLTLLNEIEELPNEKLLKNYYYFEENKEDVLLYWKQEE